MEDAIIKYKNSKPDMRTLVNHTDAFFVEKYIDIRNDNIDYPVPGNLYMFNYDARIIFDNKRKYINRKPLLLCTDYSKDSNLDDVIIGIDLITVPPKYRVPIIISVYKQYEEMIISNDALDKIGAAKRYTKLKEQYLRILLKDTGYKSSLSGFRKSYIRNSKYVESQDWPKIPYLKYSLIEGIKIDDIYKEYEIKK